MYYDGNGLPLKIGDIVLFRPPGETTRRIPGVIIGFTPKKVHVIRDSDKNYHEEHRRYYETLRN